MALSVSTRATKKTMNQLNYFDMTCLYDCLCFASEVSKV